MIVWGRRDPGGTVLALGLGIGLGQKPSRFCQPIGRKQTGLCFRGRPRLSRGAEIDLLILIRREPWSLLGTGVIRKAASPHDRRSQWWLALLGDWSQDLDRWRGHPRPQKSAAQIPLLSACG